MKDIRTVNSFTQPFQENAVFNNNLVMTEGWYITLPSCQLKDRPKTVFLGKQKLVLYRGQSGKTYALDAFCPHMGVDLGLGKVCGENIQCFFHHWQYDGSGRCQHIPAEEPLPKNLKLSGYAVEEKYGHIWVWPSLEAKCPVPEIPELEGKEVVWEIGSTYYRPCHYHVTMINGIDAQHLSTVHKINIDMKISIDVTETGSIHYILKGEIPNNTFSGKFLRWLLGLTYSYGIKYNYGTIGLLTTMKDVRLFGRYPLPMSHMIFAYSPAGEKGSRVIPIFISPKRRGIIGKLICRIMLLSARWGFYFLQNEDGKIYENIRFNTTSFLKMDRPVARFISYINGLKPCLWSEEFSAVCSKPSSAINCLNNN